MFRDNKNTIRFFIILVTMWFLGVGGVAQAHTAWLEKEKMFALGGEAYDEFGGSVSINGDYMIVGMSGDDDKGSAYIFKRDGSNWTEQAKLIALDGAIGDWFGSYVSINGDYAVVGAALDKDNGWNSGSAYIFKRSDVANDPNWYQSYKLTALDGATNDYFGQPVCISGDHVIVGAHGDDVNGLADAGSAYIFTPNNIDPNNWDQQAKLTASDAAIHDIFGYSVSISGDFAIVGAYYDDDKGSAYIFKRDGTIWTEQAKLTASDGENGDNFGSSVSISGDYAVVGAVYDDVNGLASAGSAYIFKRSDVANDPNWYEQCKLTASDGEAGDYFGGFSDMVSINGDYAIVSAYRNDGGSGSAYIFKRNDSGPNWTQQAKLTASDGATGDEFGMGVSINGQYAILGAPYDDDKGSHSGSAYVFKECVCPTADLSGDCFVDFADFAVMANQWLTWGE